MPDGTTSYLSTVVFFKEVKWIVFFNSPGRRESAKSKMLCRPVSARQPRAWSRRRISSFELNHPCGNTGFDYGPLWVGPGQVRRRSCVRAMRKSRASVARHAAIYLSHGAPPIHGPGNSATITGAVSSSGLFHAQFQSLRNGWSNLIEPRLERMHFLIFDQQNRKTFIPRSRSH